MASSLPPITGATRRRPAPITPANTCLPGIRDGGRRGYRRRRRHEPGRRTDGGDFGRGPHVSALETIRPGGAAVLEAARARRIPGWYVPAKRAVDITVAGLGLIVTLPITLAAMAGIVLVTGEGPLYRHERVGLNGRPFKMYKLRSMVTNAHERRHEVRHLNEADGPVFKLRRDPRLHAIGAFLRRTSIDELPNFVNVLLGDMAIVGPGPRSPKKSPTMTTGRCGGSRSSPASPVCGRSRAAASSRSSSGWRSTTRTSTRGPRSAISGSSPKPYRPSSAAWVPISIPRG